MKTKIEIRICGNGYAKENPGANAPQTGTQMRVLL